MTDHENFRSWYVQVLAKLYGDRDAGIVVFMVSLPLLERYLRQKTSLGTDDINDAFKDELVAMFPALRDAATAGRVWAACRHGFLHQATLSLVHKRSETPLPECVLSHDLAQAIEERDGIFRIHPVRLSKTVIAAIEADFATFAGTVAGAPPLPVVKRLDPVTAPNSYLGTRTP
jgi:hypothetical protein